MDADLFLDAHCTAMQEVQPGQLEALPFKPPSVRALLGQMLMATVQAGLLGCCLVPAAWWLWEQLCADTLCIRRNHSASASAMPCHSWSSALLIPLTTRSAAQLCPSASALSSSCFLPLYIQVAQYMITMYLTITMADNQWKMTHPFVNGLINFLVIMYPLVTMSMLIMQSGEMVLRKFFYYRMMSLQVSWAQVAAAAPMMPCLPP